MRTLGSFNHAGPDEVPIAILLRRQPLRLRWATIRSIGGPASVATKAGPFLTERCQRNASRLYKGGQKLWRRRKACPPQLVAGGTARNRLVKLQIRSRRLCPPYDLGARPYSSELPGSRGNPELADGASRPLLA